MKGIAYDIIFQNADSGEKVFAEELAKDPNVVIAANYVSDMCILQYSSIYTRIPEGPVRQKYPKQISSSECMYLLKDIIVDYEAQEKTDLIKYAILKNQTDISSLSDDQQISLFCTNTTDGVYDCPGLPRSVYASIPWGMINIDSSYERPIIADISNQPYLSWKT